VLLLIPPDLVIELGVVQGQADVGSEHLKSPFPRIMLATWNSSTSS
jgi:hypothetical protein